jgi:hypothetical protein
MVSALSELHQEDANSIRFPVYFIFYADVSNSDPVEVFQSAQLLNIVFWYGSWILLKHLEGNNNPLNVLLGKVP